MYKSLISLMAAGSALTANAQLLIDRAGARDVLYAHELQATNRFRTRFDSSDKSISVSYFRRAFTNTFEAGNLALGAKLKMSATDGWEDLLKFDRLPGIDLSLIANWTSANSTGPIWFGNARLAYKHEEYALFDATKPLNEQFSKPSFDGVSAAISAGALRSLESLPLEVSFAVSAGWERTSDYKNLPKINVADVSQIFPLPSGGQRQISGESQSVRLGTLEEFNAYPLSLTLAFDWGLKTNWTGWIPFTKKDDIFSLVVAPYGEFVPRDQGKPEHAIGAQFTIRRSKNIPINDLDSISKMASSTYPIAVFAERRNVFNQNAETKVGIALIYSF